MKNEFPNINIKNKYIKLNPKQTSKIDEAKQNKKISSHLKKRHYNKFNITTAFKFKPSKYNNIKAISLNNLISRHPNRESFSPPMFPQNSAKKLLYLSSKTINKNMMHNSSTRFIRTNSILERLNPGNYDELKKYEYYDKIENMKSYQEFLKKEKEIIPEKSINNQFVDDPNKSKVKIKSLLKPRKSIYESLYLFNPKNMIKLRPKFNKKEQFEHYIITKFIENKRKQLESKNELNSNKRNIYIILDGDIIINENYIKGFFIEFPNLSELNMLNTEQKKLLYNNIL